ncbi:hypothetical protein ACC811_37105, partial [Rhizobium ruizarguesonis]
IQEYGIFLAFLLLVLVLSFSNEFFLTGCNISNVLLQTSINVVLAIGMTFVILTRGRGRREAGADNTGKRQDGNDRKIDAAGQ